MLLRDIVSQCAKNKPRYIYGLFCLVAVALFGLVPHSAHAAGPNGMNGQGIIGVPYEIETCEDFQAIDEDLDAYYRLQNNVDCSDTSTWNGGEGFRPIGWGNDNEIRKFSGNIDGQGHSVMDVYMDLSTLLRFRVGIFEQLDSNARIYNVLFENTQIITPLAGDYIDIYIGGLAGIAEYPVMDNIHMQNTVIDITCTNAQEHYAYVGGLFGSSSAYISRVGISGTTFTSTNCPQQIIYSGGMAGRQIDGFIHDSWASVYNTFDSQSGVSEFNDYYNAPHLIGGLVGFASNTNLDQTYTFGTLTMSYTPGDWQNWNVGGLIGASQNTAIEHSFTKISVVTNTTCSGTECDYGVRNVGYLVGSNATLEEYNGNYYDGIAFGQSAFCDGEGSVTCTGVNTVGSPDPNYFFNQPSNPPMNTWDFESNWNEGCLGCTPGVPGQIYNSYPDPATDLSATITSDTEILITATYGNYIPPIATYRQQDILYKKSTDTDWMLKGYNFNGTGFMNVPVDGLEPGTQYDFKILTRIDRGYYVVSDVVSGRTARPGFVLISDCQELQNIDNGLADNYELAHDIDCSDTINWNSGAGFDPIGYVSMDYATTDPFKGVFAGNNYTISDLYIDTTGSSPGNGLFVLTDGARLQDVRIANSTQISDSPAQGGGLVAQVRNSSMTNIHVTGSTTNGAFIIYGGIVGSIIGYSQGEYDLTKSYYDGSVTLIDTVDLPMVQESYGGLIGQIQVYAPDINLKIEDNYAISNLNDISGVTGRGGGIGFIFLDTNSASNTYIDIRRVYSSGNMQFADSYPILNVAAGVIGVAIGERISVKDSFSHIDMTDSGGVMGRGGVVGGVLDSFGTPITVDISSNYFDSDRAATLSCDGFIVNTCPAISGDPSYFFNNTINPPFDTWDFTNIWKTTTTLPVFGQGVTQTISEIPSQFLSGGGNSSEGSGTPPIIDSGRQAEINNIVNRALSGSTGTAPSENPSIFEQITNAIKDFVRNLPEPLVRAFPYLLFGLVSGGVLLMSMETRRQMRHLAALRRLIAKQRSIAQQRDTFWHLAANYLRAPVTLLMGGAELLTLTAKPKIDTAKSVGAAVANKVSISKTQATTTKAITTLVTRIQTKVAAIMADIEGSETLRGIAWPKDSPAKNALQTIGFWASITSIILLLLLANYIIIDFRGINPSTISYLTQAVLFGLVAYAIYWALNGIYGVRQNVAIAERLIAQQSKALSEARGDLVGKAAGSLSTDVTALEGAVTKLPKRSNARQPLTEGAGRLRNMIDSFQLLQAAETKRLADLSPAKTTSDIDTIVSQSLKEERSTIIEKKLAINIPKLQGILFPGSTRLARQVVGTVLDNAIAFSPKGSTVDVEVVDKPGMQGILIHDQGPGVSKDQLDHMFEPFTKADGDDALRMNHEGLGIDLYVNRLIMEQLGGKISATSAVGKGTTIQLWWPAR